MKKKKHNDSYIVTINIKEYKKFYMQKTENSGIERE